jgi:hypothetical protein
MIKAKRVSISFAVETHQPWTAFQRRSSKRPRLQATQKKLVPSVCAANDELKLSVGRKTSTGAAARPDVAVIVFLERQRAKGNQTKRAKKKKRGRNSWVQIKNAAPVRHLQGQKLASPLTLHPARLAGHVLAAALMSESSGLPFCLVANETSVCR